MMMQSQSCPNYTIVNNLIIVSDATRPVASLKHTILDDLEWGWNILIIKSPRGDIWPWILKVKLYLGKGRPDCRSWNERDGSR